MTTSNTGASVDFTRFSRMRTAAHKDQDATMQKVADEFEAMFAETMLKAARESSAGVKAGGALLRMPDFSLRRYIEAPS